MSSVQIIGGIVSLLLGIGALVASTRISRLERKVEELEAKIKNLSRLS